MEGRCINCNRLIFDVADPAMLSPTVVCQHCGTENEIPKRYMCRVVGCGAIFDKPIMLAGHVRKEHKGR